MNSTLYRLVYLSQNQIGGDDLAVEKEIGQILASARRNNEKMGITGALMFNSQCFAQVLEGEQDKLQVIFERIQCDFRHADVVILDFSEIPKRGFGNWSMAYLGGGTGLNNKLDNIAQETHFDPTRLDGDTIYTLMLRRLQGKDSGSQTNRAA